MKKDYVFCRSMLGWHSLAGDINSRGRSFVSDTLTICLPSSATFSFRIFVAFPTKILVLVLTRSSPCLLRLIYTSSFNIFCISQKYTLSISLLTHNCPHYRAKPLPCGVVYLILFSIISCSFFLTINPQANLPIGHHTSFNNILAPIPNHKSSFTIFLP